MNFIVYGYEIDRRHLVHYGSITFSVAKHSSVIISNRGIELRSFLLNISRTIESRFHIPSGSRPLSGLNKEAHSAATGGAVELK